jgi:hypothetical protein
VALAGDDKGWKHGPDKKDDKKVVKVIKNTAGDGGDGGNADAKCLIPIGISAGALFGKGGDVAQCNAAGGAGGAGGAATIGD